MRCWARTVVLAQLFVIPRFWRKNVKSSSLGYLGSIIGLSAGLLSTAALADTTAGGPRPILELREKHQDGGVVEEGTVVPFKFEVTNRGQADLEITQVKPSCGCTVTQWDRVIKPGAHGTIAAQ